MRAINIRVFLGALKRVPEPHRAVWPLHHSQHTVTAKSQHTVTAQSKHSPRAHRAVGLLHHAPVQYHPGLSWRRRSRHHARPLLLSGDAVHARYDHLAMCQGACLTRYWFCCQDMLRLFVCRWRGVATCHHIAPPGRARRFLQSAGWMPHTPMLQVLCCDCVL